MLGRKCVFGCDWRRRERLGLRVHREETRKGEAVEREGDPSGRRFSTPRITPSSAGLVHVPSRVRRSAPSS